MKIILKTLLLLMIPLFAFAMRGPAPIVLPVDDGTYRFVVRENESENNHFHIFYKAGHVEAYLKKTGEKIWDKYLCTIIVNPFLERDVQEVFVQKMYLKEPSQLVVENENGKRFILERSTGKLMEEQHFQRDPADRSMYYGADRYPSLLGDNLFIEVLPESYGEDRTFRASDLATGKIIWETKVRIPKQKKNLGKRDFFMTLNGQGEFEVSWWGKGYVQHTYVIDSKSGKTIRQK